MSDIETAPKIRQHTFEARRNRHPSETATCSCGARWPAVTAVCHCSACHQSFTGLTAFDAHRDGDHAKGTRHCRNPADIGLIDAGRNYPCWGNPGDGTQWWK